MEYGYAWLCNARNEMEAGLITGILDNDGISHRCFSRGAGGIYGMPTLFGVEIQVEEGALGRAKELLQAYFQAEPEHMEEFPEAAAQEEKA